MSTGRTPKPTEREAKVLRDMQLSRSLSMEQVRAVRNWKAR